jgi:hypothetical protein
MAWAINNAAPYLYNHAQRVSFLLAEMDKQKPHGACSNSTQEVPSRKSFSYR